MNTNIYKLKFTTKQQAIDTLIDKGVIDEELNNTNKTHSVVWLPKQVVVGGEYDEETGDVIVEPVFSEDVLVDIMTENTIEFGEFEIHPNNHLHNWV